VIFSYLRRKRLRFAILIGEKKKKKNNWQRVITRGQSETEEGEINNPGPMKGVGLQISQQNLHQKEKDLAYRREREKLKNTALCRAYNTVPVWKKGGGIPVRSAPKKRRVCGYNLPIAAP